MKEMEFQVPQRRPKTVNDKKIPPQTTNEWQYSRKATGMKYIKIGPFNLSGFGRKKRH